MSNFNKGEDRLSRVDVLARLSVLHHAQGCRLVINDEVGVAEPNDLSSMSLARQTWVSAYVLLRFL
jgi:hypothetical protein